MNPQLHELITTYGYWLMAFGALIEGETFLLAGGIAAQQGILHLPGLLLLALAGSFVHDCAFFFTGRFFGEHYFRKKPQFMVRADIILRLVDRYGIWLIIGFRYAYGLRTIIPLVLGISSISTKKFIFFDIVGGILWSCTFILGGYFIGHAFERFLHQLAEYENFGLAVVVVGVSLALVGGGIWYWWRQKRKKIAHMLMLKIKGEE